VVCGKGGCGQTIGNPPFDAADVRLLLGGEQSNQKNPPSVVADFPLILTRKKCPKSLAGMPRKLNQMKLLAARNKTNGNLCGRERSPTATRLSGCRESICRSVQSVRPRKLHGAARVMRFDFHFTPEGGRI